MTDVLGVRFLSRHSVALLLLYCYCFGINTAVVPVPIENFFYFNDPLFISTVIVVSQ